MFILSVSFSFSLSLLSVCWSFFFLSLSFCLSLSLSLCICLSVFICVCQFLSVCLCLSISLYLYVCLFSRSLSLSLSPFLSLSLCSPTTKAKPAFLFSVQNGRTCTSGFLKLMNKITTKKYFWYFPLGSLGEKNDTMFWFYTAPMPQLGTKYLWPCARLQ